MHCWSKYTPPCQTKSGLSIISFHIIWKLLIILRGSTRSSRVKPGRGLSPVLYYFCWEFYKLQVWVRNLVLWLPRVLHWVPLVSKDDILNSIVLWKSPRKIYFLDFWEFFNISKSFSKFMFAVRSKESILLVDQQYIRGQMLPWRNLKNFHPKKSGKEQILNGH